MQEYLKSPLPLVTNSTYRNYQGKTVIVHGRVTAIKNNTLYLNINPEMDNDTELIVKNFNQLAEVGEILKVVGKVYPDFSLEFFECYHLNEYFDLKLLYGFITISQHDEFAPMFYNTD